MQKLVSAAVALALLSMLVPAGSASESVTAPYTGALGTTPGIGLVVCPACSFDVDGDGEDDVTVDPIGGVRLYASTFYNNVIITPSDDIYGSDAAISTCFWNPDGDNSCDSEEDWPSDRVCGSVPLLGSPFAGDYVTVFVFTLSVFVDPDLEVCGGSSGSVTGSFF